MNDLDDKALNDLWHSNEPWDAHRAKRDLIDEILDLRAENAELRDFCQRVDRGQYSNPLLRHPWDGPERWWKCECGVTEGRPANVHAAVCSACQKQMQPA